MITLAPMRSWDPRKYEQICNHQPCSFTKLGNYFQPQIAKLHVKLYVAGPQKLTGQDLSPASLCRFCVIIIMRSDYYTVLEPEMPRAFRRLLLSSYDYYTNCEYTWHLDAC